MFIKVRKNDCPVLLPIADIALIEPFDGGEKVSIKSRWGDLYFWDGNLDAFQDVLIDCAAQFTAPIASRIDQLDDTMGRLCRNIEDVLESTQAVIEEESAQVHASFHQTQTMLSAIESGQRSTQMTDVEKDAARYQWLKSQARIEDRDGGYTGLFAFPMLVQRDALFNTYYKSLDEAIDNRMGANSTNC